MPLVQIKGIAGVLSSEQKEDLLRRITEAVVAVEGEGVRPITWVLIDEVPSGEWSVAGQPVTTDAFKHLMSAGR